MARAACAPPGWAVALWVAAVARCAAAACDTAAQHSALLAFWAATEGEQWDWQWFVPEEDDHCGWRGVLCEDGCVVRLDMYSRLSTDARLGGTLPEVWDDLATLRVLLLNGNQVNDVGGTLPASFAALQALTLLDVRGNRMEGEIGVLGSMTALEEIWLERNDFNGTIPSTLGALQALTRFDVSHNDLSGTLAPALGGMPPTATIDLHENPRLGGILPHTLLAHDNLRLDGTQVAIGCDAGWRYDATAFGCVICDAGFSTPAGAYAETCAACEPGMVAASMGSVCERCPLGTFANGTANTGCEPCPTGLAAIYFGSPRCEPCGAGRISVDDGTACQRCPPGSSTDGVAVATSCAPCAPGSAAVEPGAPVCEPCPAGATSNAAGTACDPCPAGSSTEGAAGAPSCTACPIGSASEAGAAVCDICLPGTVAATEGLAACEPCPAGSTTEGAAGASACTLCPAGSFGGAGNATCTPCAPGAFAATEGLTACAPCPAGTHQPESGAATSCPACRYPGRCREGNECASGYAGAGCLFCAVGHFRLSNVCLTCPVVPWPLIVLVVLGAGLLYAASKNRLGARQTTVLKIVLFYVQMVVVASALQVQWPSTQTGFVEAMSFASAEIGLPLAECYVSVGWYTGFAWSLAGPTTVVAVFWIATVYSERRRRQQWTASEDAEQDFTLMGRASHMRRLWISAFAAMHLPLVRVLLTAFDCERDADGHLAVAGSDDGTRCDTTTHVVVQAVSGIALGVIGLVLPSAAALFVLWLRRTDRLDKGSVRAAWGALYEGYRADYCYLEGVVAVRKVFVTMTLVIPGMSIEWRSVLLLAQSVGWGVFVLVRRPYVRVRGRAVFGLLHREDVINELEVVVSVVVSLHQGMAGLAAGTHGGVVWLEAGVVLLVITVGVLLAALWQATRIGRGFEVAPTGFSQAKAERDQRKLFQTYLGALGRDDFEEAARLRAEGVRHARQTREFAEWRTDENKVSTNEVPFLEMVIAEETTDRAELEAGIEATDDKTELGALFFKSMTAGHFDLAQRAHARRQGLGAGAPCLSGSSGAGTSSTQPTSLQTAQPSSSSGAASSSQPASLQTTQQPPPPPPPTQLPSVGRFPVGPALRR